MYGRVLQNGVIQICDRLITNTTPPYHEIVEHAKPEEKVGFNLCYRYEAQNGIVHKFWEYREIVEERED